MNFIFNQLQFCHFIKEKKFILQATRSFTGQRNRRNKILLGKETEGIKISYSIIKQKNKTFF